MLPDGHKEQSIGDGQATDGQGDASRQQQVHDVPLLPVGDLCAWSDPRMTCSYQLEIVRDSAVLPLPSKGCVSRLIATKAAIQDLIAGKLMHRESNPPRTSTDGSFRMRSGGNRRMGERTGGCILLVLTSAEAEAALTTGILLDGLAAAAREA